MWWWDQDKGRQRVKERMSRCVLVCATSCECCFRNSTAAGVRSSKLSAQPASQGKYIYTPDTKDSTDERLVGVVSAESPITSLHTVEATNLVLGTTLSSSLIFSIEVQREKTVWNDKMKSAIRYFNPWMDFPFQRWCPQPQGLTATPHAARCRTMCAWMYKGCIYPDAKGNFS